MRVSAAAIVCAVLLVASCGVSPKVQFEVDGTGQAASGGVAAVPPGPVPAGFERFYGQHLTWADCGAGVDCAKAIAPLSWQDPAAGEITLALKRKPASGDRLGSLLVNPGGPGGSGTELVDWVPVGRKVRAAYDVVGWDPRGVDTSTPVRCLDDKRKNVALAEDFDDDAAGLAALSAAADAWADACKDKTGELLGHVDTQSAARDMDMLRAVLGDRKLTFLGYSYGTKLGAAYAGLFPKNVGRLVLDGAIDVTLTADEETEQQAVGFEQALRAFVKDCQAGSKCPLQGGLTAGLRQIRGLLNHAKDHPLRTSDRDGRRLTQTLAFYGIALTLYSDDSWPMLRNALGQALDQNDGTRLLALADLYNDRSADGGFTKNSAEAFRAVNCLDSRQNPDPAFMRAQRDRLVREAPTMGSAFAWGGLLCQNWPYPVVKQGYDEAAKGAAPIVVVGTTNDPATPYAGAQALAKLLDSGVLVTWEGEGHTAYGRSNSCISKAVDGYLVEGDVPKDGLVC